MISKDMYRVLKHIPRAPERISLKELSNKKKWVLAHLNQVSSILSEAKKSDYIAFSSDDPFNRVIVNSFHLTEKGQVGIEEYKHRHLDSRRSLWAIIISIIGLILSTAISIIGLLLKQSAAG